MKKTISNQYSIWTLTSIIIEWPTYSTFARRDCDRWIVFNGHLRHRQDQITNPRVVRVRWSGTGMPAFNFFVIIADDLVVWREREFSHHIQHDTRKCCWSSAHVSKDLPLSRQNSIELVERPMLTCENAALRALIIRCVFSACCWS